MPKPLNLAILLDGLNACGDARRWLGSKSAAAAWRTCPDGAWLLWLAARLGVERQLIVRAALACARTALPECSEETIGMVLLCHHLTEEWLEGREDLDTVRAAAAAGWAAAAARQSARRQRLADCARLVRRCIPYRVVLTAARTHQQ